MRGLNLYTFVLFGLLILIQATSCNKNQTPVDPTLTDTIPCPDTVETLPPKTHKGYNTIACLVNGKVWVAKVGEYFGTPAEEFEGNRILYGNQGNINDPNFKIRKYRRFSNSCDTVSSFISFSVNKVDLGEKLPIRNSWVFNDSYNCRILTNCFGRSIMLL